MRRLQLGFLVCAMIVSMGLVAQNNMVPNPSFELTEKKVKNGEGEIGIATPWISPSLDNQADIYSKGNKKGYGIPTNDKGYMDVDDGVKYAGFRAYSYRNKLPRTYLQVKLTKALIAGKKYCVQYKIALSKTSKYSSNGIGMYLSEKKPKDKDFQNYAMTPQIRNPRNKIFEDRHAWSTVCGVYIATGNERYIAIGNFTPDAEMTDKRDFLKMKKLKEFPQLQVAEAYYYIDEVSVINLEELDVCQCEDEDAGGNTMKVVYSTSESDGLEKTAAEQINLKNVFFSKNSKTPSSAGDVREVIDLMKANPEVSVTIIGHMDKVEDRDNLNDLSAERAQAIYDYMVKNGIESSRLSHKGVKSTDPLDDSGTQASLAKNRRVSFDAK